MSSGPKEKEKFLLLLYLSSENRGNEMMLFGLTVFCVYFCPCCTVWHALQQCWQVSRYRKIVVEVTSLRHFWNVMHKRYTTWHESQLSHCLQWELCTTVSMLRYTSLPLILDYFLYLSSFCFFLQKKCSLRDCLQYRQVTCGCSIFRFFFLFAFAVSSWMYSLVRCNWNTDENLYSLGHILMLAFIYFI